MVESYLCRKTKLEQRIGHWILINLIFPRDLNGILILEMPWNVDLRCPCIKENEGEEK